MRPFSDNIIFYDTEFSTLDPYIGEILSIGMVKMNGEELYLELEYSGKYNEWVKENILPTLKKPKISREKAKEKIREFIGNTKPYLMGYFDQYDAVYLNKLFSPEGVATLSIMIPIDFAPILFANGVNPRGFWRDEMKEFIKSLGIDYDKYHIHNALHDARLLRETYLKFLESHE